MEEIQNQNENLMPEFEEEDYNEQSGADKSIRGYRIVIIILSVILVALSALYYGIHRQQMEDNQLLQADRDSIQNELGELEQEFDNLKTNNDSISANLALERGRVDSLISQIKKERSLNLRKIRRYQKEVGTLRSLMKGYIRQIDSLNTLNKHLISENVGFRKEISSAKLRADMAEEKAAELDNKVRVGSVIKAREIRLVPLNRRNSEVSRVKKAARLRIDFVMTANELAQPGNKVVYARITSPDGYVLTTASTPSFEFEGERLTYSEKREIDYQNKDLDVSIFFDATGFTAGTYKVELYCDAHLIGQSSMSLR